VSGSTPGSNEVGPRAEFSGREKSFQQSSSLKLEFSTITVVKHRLNPASSQRGQNRFESKNPIASLFQGGEILANISVYLPAIFLSLTLFLVPLFPDEKLNRLKLIAFGVGLILTCLSWALIKVNETNWSFFRTHLDPYLALYFISAILYYKSSANPAVASSELQRMIFSVGAFFCDRAGMFREKRPAFKRNSPVWLDDRSFFNFHLRHFAKKRRGGHD